MPAFAPRIPIRLAKEVGRIDDGKLPIAEVCRRVGAAAEFLGVPRPSYESVRLLVHDARARRTARAESRDVLVGVALYTRPPTDLLDHVAGDGVPRRRGGTRSN